MRSSARFMLEELAAGRPARNGDRVASQLPDKRPALAAGFDSAQGEIIVSLDGDQQHDPADIPALIEKLHEGYDIASGWRYPRVDNYLTRGACRIGHRQRNDEQSVRREVARLRHNVQGLPAGDDSGHQFVRGVAPLHSGAGQSGWRAHRRSADQECGASGREVALWLGTHVSRDARTC